MPLTKIASLWKPREKNSKSLASGQTIGVEIALPAGSRLIFLRNEGKEGSQPDFELFVSTPDGRGHGEPDPYDPTRTDEEAPF